MGKQSCIRHEGRQQDHGFDHFAPPFRIRAARRFAGAALSV
ncbi:MAG: hypothetical protein NXH82_07835 [Rhodobacteraceae bacterium]|nr:hypothetical protein [Paracoccaceae bacterium]